MFSSLTSSYCGQTSLLLISLQPGRDFLFFSINHLSFLRQMKCCGWAHPSNWSDNQVIRNSSEFLYSCSCRNASLPGSEIQLVGLCEHLSADLPIFETVLALIFCWSWAGNAQHPGRGTTWNGAPCGDVKMWLQREMPAATSTHSHLFHRMVFRLEVNMESGYGRLLVVIDKVGSGLN